jgi:hypothetical protein
MVCGDWRLKKVFLFVINVMVAGGECLEWWGFDSVRKKKSVEVDVGKLCSGWSIFIFCWWMIFGSPFSLQLNLYL